jgi:hypothetical protein
VATAFGNQPSVAAFCFASVKFARQQGAFSTCSVRPALVVQNSCILSIESRSLLRSETGKQSFVEL